MGKPVGSAFVLPELPSTPGQPSAGKRSMYLDSDGRLVLLRPNGAVRQHLPVEVSPDISPPANPEVDDLWIVPDANPASAPANFAIGPNDPQLTQGMWVQTGLGPNGDDWTLWIEDGT